MARAWASVWRGGLGRLSRGRALGDSETKGGRKKGREEEREGGRSGAFAFAVVVVRIRCTVWEEEEQEEGVISHLHRAPSLAAIITVVLIISRWSHASSAPPCFLLAPRTLHAPFQCRFIEPLSLT